MALRCLGGFHVDESGLARADTLWKALGKAAVVKETIPGARYVLVTTDKPARKQCGWPGACWWLLVPGETVYDVIALRAG